MKQPVNDLLNDLQQRLIRQSKQVAQLKQQPSQSLNAKPSEQAWSALECIEHLNRYGRFYLPEVRRALAANRHAASPVFKSGWLGNYFATSMLPKENLNTMRTFKVMNPSGSTLGPEVLEECEAQITRWQQLLAQCEEACLNRTKTAISISKLIKLRLGDTLRVVIYHQDRHMEQAQKAVRSAQQHH